MCNSHGVFLTTSGVVQYVIHSRASVSSLSRAKTSNCSYGHADTDHIQKTNTFILDNSCIIPASIVAMDIIEVSVFISETVSTFHSETRPATNTFEYNSITNIET
ncbi:hypothetical protein M5689_019904 [Euphorbia peplus]|nr:hypothetical protein M5689_019904 [Euphorbia peplus]